MRTYDFPQNPGDTNGQTWNNPQITGFYDTETGATYGAPTPGFGIAFPYNDRSIPPMALPVAARWLPAMSAHTHHRSAGIPTAFPLQTNALMVDGVPQDVARGLRDLTAGKYPSQVFNINNAARNLVEIIANEARNDNGDYRIRIYTIGMGQLVPLLLGTRPESSESILKRIANDRTSPDFNAAQLEGQVLLRPDSRRRGASVCEHPEPDSALDQVTRPIDAAARPRSGGGRSPSLRNPSDPASARIRPSRYRFHDRSSILVWSYVRLDLDANARRHFSCGVVHLRAGRFRSSGPPRSILNVISVPRPTTNDQRPTTMSSV